MSSDPTRRALLKAMGAAPLACAWPRVQAGMRWLPGGNDVALCVLELAGGNDGLATLVPVDDDRWVERRPTLRGVREGAHALADGYALHPSMPRLARVFADGDLAVVHGVGYEPPDRSHFRSRDVWYTADPALGRIDSSTTGWMGRAADLLADRGAAVPGMSVGSLGVPLALAGRRAVVPAVRSLDDYELVVDPAGDVRASREALARLVREAPGATSDALRAEIADVSRAALDGVEDLRAALARYRPRTEWPDSPLAEHLQLFTRAVVSGFGTRLFHLSLGGFDTHANQAPVHAGLLAELDGALGACVEELRAQGAFDEVVVLVWSEFGRRVTENRSQGTDHGAAAPVFVLGGGVEGGLCGRAPDLDDLDDGDLRTTCDFRRVYATLLARLGLEPASVLGDAFEALAF